MNIYIYICIFFRVHIAIAQTRDSFRHYVAIEVYNATEVELAYRYPPAILAQAPGAGGGREGN